jgi:hypothetical protein
MKRIGIVGLCLAAMFALSAMAASSAFAGQYITCTKVSKVTVKYIDKGKEKSKAIYEGKYLTNTCTTLAPEPGKYYEGPEGKYERGSAVGIKSTDKTKTATLASAAGTITCKSSTGTDEITGSKTDKNVTNFKTCVLSVTKGACTTPGDASGEITSTAVSRLIDHGEKGPSGGEPAEGEVWDEFESESGPTGLLAEFVCAPGVIFETSGTLSGVATPVNAKGSTKGTTTFGAGKGEQDLVTEFSENGGISFENTGPNVETATASIAWSSAVEVLAENE